MRRIQLFLIILIATLVALSSLAFVSWYLATTSPTYYSSSWMKQMWSGTGSTTNNGGMSGMMGNGNTSTASTTYLWIIPVLLGAVVGIAVIGVAFYYAYPELKYIRGNTTCNPSTSNTQLKTSAVNSTSEKITSVELPKVSNNCDVLLKTMTPEEKKVLNVLVAHQGKYLQKYAVKESGLSRLKTHRIIARFAERDIVSVKEFGNTNEIVVSDWVKT